VIELIAHAEGVCLPVRAQPGARKNEVRGIQEGALKLAVTQVAEKGKANKAVIQLLCKSLKLRRSQVSLLAGHTSHGKRFLIREIDAATLQKRIDAVVRAS
jgi:uncharacterized protein (TIGR00251 family)